MSALYEELAERIQPQAIYTHHGGDLNIDHVIVHRAVLTATRPMAGYPIREIYTFEIPSSTDWAFQSFSPCFRPNVFVNISNTLDIKIKAIKMYENELRPYPHPRSQKALSAVAQRWGSICGFDSAEAFELVRSLRA